MRQVTGLKKAKNHIILSIDQNEIICQSELVIKYHLAVGKTLDDETYQRFIEENAYLSCLRLALEKLKKMMTIGEMKALLSEQTFTLGVQKQVLHYLIEKKYLDDIHYAKTYLSLKKHQEGPTMIEFKLKQKGVAEVIIHGLWATYDEYETLLSLIQNKLSQMKKKTKKQAFQTIKMQMLAKGFHMEVIDKVLVDLNDVETFDEEKLIVSAYDKIYKSYSKKLSGYELEYKIKEKLYQKGFSYDMIKAYLEKIRL